MRPPVQMRVIDKLRFVPLLCVFLLASCSLITHKIDIQQGNYVDQAMIAKLKPEMTRSQVKFILGTPLITDSFHSNRWDYVYLTGKAEKVKVRHKITVVFDGDKLMNVEGDIVPPDTLKQASTVDGAGVR